MFTFQSNEFIQRKDVLRMTMFLINKVKNEKNYGERMKTIIVLYEYITRNILDFYDKNVSNMSAMKIVVNFYNNCINIIEQYKIMGNQQCHPDIIQLFIDTMERASEELYPLYVAIVYSPKSTSTASSPTQPTQETLENPRRSLRLQSVSSVDYSKM